MSSERTRQAAMDLEEDEYTKQEGLLIKQSIANMDPIQASAWVKSILMQQHAIRLCLEHNMKLIQQLKGEGE